MIKELVKLLVIGSGCSGVAIISTTFSGIDDGSAILIKHSENRGKKITKISSYGEIEAYGQQNGCVFRIIDETETGGPKDYSLAEFLAIKKKDIPDLEDQVTKVAEGGRNYCGKDAPVMAIFYVNDPGNPPEKPSKKIFKLKGGQKLINNHKPNT